TYAQVLYVQADVTDASAMRQAVERANERFGAIHGVIHAAGLEGRQSLVEADLAQFSQVLAPKVQGTLVLDEVLRDQPLDFVCYFASIAAVLGDFGVGSYAMANRFLMAYARTRQTCVSAGQAQGRTLAIAWPLWA